MYRLNSLDRLYNLLKTLQCHHMLKLQVDLNGQYDGDLQITYRDRFVLKWNPIDVPNHLVKWYKKFTDEITINYGANWARLFLQLFHVLHILNLPFTILPIEYRIEYDSVSDRQVLRVEINSKEKIKMICWYDESDKCYYACPVS